MSCFYDRHSNALKLKCDCCKNVVIISEGETDRLFANDYVHENGWKTTKRSDKWIHLCPDCKKAIEEANRQKYIERS